MENKKQHLTHRTLRVFSGLLDVTVEFLPQFSVLMVILAGLVYSGGRLLGSYWQVQGQAFAVMVLEGALAGLVIWFAALVLRAAVKGMVHHRKQKNGILSVAWDFLLHLFRNKHLIYELFQGLLSIGILAFIAYLYFSNFRPGLFLPVVSTENAQQLYPTTLPGSNFSCSINLPQQPSFILRLDDVQAYAWSSIMKNITDEVLKRNMSIVLGVIPKNIDKDTSTVGYILSKEGNPRVEIALHGLNHTNNEFLNVTPEQLINMTWQGIDKLHNTFGIYPVTFIPPYNAYNNNVTDAFSNTTIRIVSGRQHEYKFDGNILYVGYTQDTKNNPGGESAASEINRDVVNVSTILDGCKVAFTNNNLCVILIHPQDYVSADDKTINSTKYANFLELLDGLEKTGAKSVTFKDLITCRPQKANAG